MELRNFQLVLLFGLGALGLYLIAFFVWGWLKVKRAASQTVAPELPQLKASPKGLEEETAWLIQQTTGRTARVCTGVDKGLVDIEVLDDAGQVRGIAQCVPLTLAYSFTPGNVQALHQVRQSLHVKSAYLVTPGYFEYAVQLEAKKLKIKLINGAALERLQRRVNQTPTDTPAIDLFEDHSRWQRPPSFGPASPVPVLASQAARHMLIPRTPPVVVPREEEEAAAYKPSVKPISPEEMRKPTWPTAVSYKRNLPTVIIKPMPTETIALDTPETSEDITFQEVQQMLQARKHRPTRTTLPIRSNRR